MLIRDDQHGKRNGVGGGLAGWMDGWRDNWLAGWIDGWTAPQLKNVPTANLKIDSLQQ